MKAFHKIKTFFVNLRKRLFRQLLAEAYPDGAKFLSLLQQIPVEHRGDIFELRGNFNATGFVFARGLQTDYQNWEDETIKSIEKKYPDLKILVFHYPSAIE